jgi:nicotinic acid mononucleotide adenylyltransferase
MNIEDIILSVNKSNTTLRILEVGAGVPISSEFFNYRGASKTIYSTESYYSREAFEKVFGYLECRAVSNERLYHINENDKIFSDLSENLYNTVLSTTFQLDNSVHGWISIHTLNKTRYYHISLHEKYSREEYIKTIGEIGIKLLYSFINNDEILPNCYVDIVLDKHLSPLFKDTLDIVSKTEKIATIFTKDGNIDRLEYITRDVDSLIVYKGSFNPISKSHEEIMTITENKYPNSKAIYCLSYNTYQKGFQTTESFLKRIRYINSLGYDVMVLNEPLFKDCFDFIRNKYDNKIIFPMGVDTINRILVDYIYEESFLDKRFEVHFLNAIFAIFHREEDIDSNFLEYSKKVDYINIITDNIHKDISSTKIRELLDCNNLEELKKLVSEKVYNNLTNEI